MITSPAARSMVSPKLAELTLVISDIPLNNVLIESSVSMQSVPPSTLPRDEMTCKSVSYSETSSSGPEHSYLNGRAISYAENSPFGSNQCDPIAGSNSGPEYF